MTESKAGKYPSKDVKYVTKPKVMKRKRKREKTTKQSE